MSNPNRVMANARRVQCSDYVTFPDLGKAARAARLLREQGFKVRESKFRIGPRGIGQRYNYRVSVYWDEAGAGPDMQTVWRAGWDKPA